MKNKREYPALRVSKKGENWLSSGHPWLYESDIEEMPEGLENGEIVDAFGPKEKYLGSGFLSLVSKIKVRLLSRNANDCFDDAFFIRRLQYAYDYRKAVLNDDDLKCCRLVFGESDQLPGLTVDRFNDLLSVQFATFGMDQRKGLILDSLYEILKNDGQNIQGIYIRNDLNARKLEGLDLYKGWYESSLVPKGNRAETIIVENGIQYYVDVENGQKTGFFLDQKFNRQLVGNIAHNKRVLDCFTHTGSFALNAAKGDAKSVTAVDISELACQQARRNAELNGLDVSFVCADVFEYLDQVKKHDYDLIILDPPAFTKSRDTVKAAFNGYKQINLKAMKKLGKGGYLATCSCSHFMPHPLFEKMLKEASQEAGVSLKQISVTQQGKDHPILWDVEETNYLKFYLFQIL